MFDLLQFLKDENTAFKQNALMKDYTTLKIGGPADMLIEPSRVDELKKIIDTLKQNKIPVTFVGNGSNLLVSDKGIRGAVIKFGKNFSTCSLESEDVICAQSGATMAHIASFALEHSLTGFEFASGIPGTLGGGIMMNAGAYKGELKDVVFSVTALCADGTLKTFCGNELDFSYRHSCFTGTDMLIVEAKIKLAKGDKAAISEQMQIFAQKRRTTQPLEYPSAGSAFKRPKEGYAAAMIDECGLKGYSVGDAQVSEKHAGFIINKGSATAAELRRLIADVQQKVYEKFSVMLEPEIVFIGED